MSRGLAAAALAAGVAYVLTRDDDAIPVTEQPGNERARRTLLKMPCGVTRSPGSIMTDGTATGADWIREFNLWRLSFNAANGILPGAGKVFPATSRTCAIAVCQRWLDAWRAAKRANRTNYPLIAAPSGYYPGLGELRDADERVAGFGESVAVPRHMLTDLGQAINDVLAMRLGAERLPDRAWDTALQRQLWTRLEVLAIRLDGRGVRAPDAEQEAWDELIDTLTDPTSYLDKAVSGVVGLLKRPLLVGALVVGGYLVVKR